MERTRSADDGHPVTPEATLEVLLATSVLDLDLTLKARLSLIESGALYIGELVQMTEEDLLRIRSFGPAAVGKIKNTLSQLGLCLGMKISDWKGIEPGHADTRPDDA